MSLEELSLHTSIARLKESTINDNARFFNSREEVPDKAISLGILSIFKAKKIILLASGKNKASAIAKILNNDTISTKVPASILKLHPDVTIIVDEEAYSETQISGVTMERELEVKVLGMDFDDLKERVISLGGILISKEEQINTLIDSSDKPIKTYLDAYLRIRETRDLISNKEKTVITLKKSIDNHGLRDNLELTTDVGTRKLC